jgi:hypothetical protein
VLSYPVTWSTTEWGRFSLYIRRMGNTNVPVSVRPRKSPIQPRTNGTALRGKTNNPGEAASLALAFDLLASMSPDYFKDGGHQPKIQHSPRH